jgi:penicillin-binding protein 1A
MRKWIVGIALLVSLLFAAAGGLWAWAAQDLPDEAELAQFSAALSSTVRDIDGNIVASFTRERRIYLAYNEIPPRLVHAFISAEDKTFFEHGGLDWLGIANAMLTNVEGWFTGRRPVGASTITQQVAKSLIGNEVTLTRKLREAILARRIEQTFTKQQILELYLNQIFLGRNAYGVEAAAQAYFGKTAARLDLAEQAYLAILPKAPSTYSPVTQNARAVARRDYVLRQMLANGYIGEGERATATAQPLVAIRNVAPRAARPADYFIEDVRRTLLARYGESEGRNSVYGGGLWIRTSVDAQRLPALRSLSPVARAGDSHRYRRWLAGAAGGDAGVAGQRALAQGGGDFETGQ